MDGDPLASAAPVDTLTPDEQDEAITTALHGWGFRKKDGIEELPRHIPYGPPLEERLRQALALIRAPRSRWPAPQVPPQPSPALSAPGYAGQHRAGTGTLPPPLSRYERARREAAAGWCAPPSVPLVAGGGRDALTSQLRHVAICLGRRWDVAPDPTAPPGTHGHVFTEVGEPRFAAHLPDTDVLWLLSAVPLPGTETVAGDVALPGATMRINLLGNPARVAMALERRYLLTVEEYQHACAARAAHYRQTADR